MLSFCLKIIEMQQLEKLYYIKNMIQCILPNFFHYIHNNIVIFNKMQYYVMY